MLGRGLSFTTNTMLTKVLFLFTGSIGIAVTTKFWFAIGITGFAMRVTILACIIFIYLRKNIILEKANK